MISLLQLQYFCALAKEPNLTRTAERLFISQSTLSAAISRLEQELGFPLFDRRNGRMFLNESGRIYREQIEEALAKIGEAADLARMAEARNRNVVRVSASHSRIWQEMALHLMSEHPGIKVAFKEENLSTSRRRLLDGKLDFCVTGAGDLDPSGLDMKEVAVWPLCLRVPPGHPFAGRKEISLKEIGDEPYIDCAEGLTFRIFCDRILEKAGVRVNRVFECESAARPEIILSGNGIGIAVDHFTTNRFFEGIPKIPITDPDTERHVWMYWKKGRQFTPAMEVFSDYMTRWIDRKVPGGDR